MAPNLTIGTFKIVSLIDGNPPTSVNLVQPGFQIVYLNGPVTTWVVKKESDKNYLFSLGGYPFTGVDDDKNIIATINPEQNTMWTATYREYNDAYTISPSGDEINGWTVADANDPNPEIVLRPIISTKSIPPQFIPPQLFRFQEINE